MSPRRRLARWMAPYAQVHRHPINRATHLVGVPLIVYALLGWMGDLGLVPLGLLGWGYLRVERGAAAVTLLWFLGLWWLARSGGVALTPGVAFLVGWAFQFLGHAFEGQRPALLDNLAQALVAPLFVTVEALQGLGLYRDVGACVADLVRDLDAA